ncbi:helix-turn-helix domain containing protein [Streptomyces ossamyceticus]|nr:TetR/AcrR family transcriptional regulator [Streptomyces neyagawaensis]MDG5809258.1 helix-turn-helix domain containing protein [Streptomyces ossamyceticus]
MQQGPQAPLDEIARRAGVGNATLYRHFSGRATLLAEVLERVATACAEAAGEAAAREDDLFAALSLFLQTAARQRVASLCCLSGELATARPELVRQKNRLVHAAQLLLTRAQQAGQVRADVCLEELMAAVTQLSRPLPGTSWTAVDQFSPRLLQSFFDGLLVPDRA